MAKAKKQRSPEEQAVIDARMAKIRAAKQAKQNQNPQTQSEPTTLPQKGPDEQEVTEGNTPPAPEPHDPGNPQEPTVTELQRQILELKAFMFDNQVGSQPASGPTLTDRGIVGTKERYPVNPELYPDPRERLSNEARLQPVAFKYNYELNYTCNPTKRYQTQDGVWFVEPQFTLELNRIVLDELGEPTNQRYTICRGIFFEDPETAIQMAMDMGLPIDDANEKTFLDEMRYLRMRDWLFGAFYETLDTTPKKNKREISIDGQLVEMFEVSGENPQTIPFGQLKSKVRS